MCALGLFKYGYGYWNLIRNDLRNCSELSFNWLAKSRTVMDVQKRCDQLIASFKKEFQLENGEAKPAAKQEKKTMKPQKEEKTEKNG